MLKSQRSQPGNPGNGSDLNDDWVRVCDTCGDVGDESLLVSCNKCTDGAAHTYCMRVKLFEKPKHWVCEDCAPTAGTNKLVEDDVEVGARRKTGHLSKSSINLESSKGAKFNSRSSYPSKSKTTGVSSTGNLSAQRHGVPLEAPTAQKARATERRAVSSGSSKPCKQSLLSEDFSCEESEWAQTKSVKDIVYSLPPRSGISQEKEKVPRACGDRKRISTLAQLDEKKRVLEGKVISHQTSTTQNHPSLGREPPSEKLGKAKLGAAGTATSLKPSSNGSFLKEKLTYGLGDGSPNLDSQIDIAQNKCSLLKSNSSKAANLKPKGQLIKAGRLQKQKVKRDPTFHDDRKGKKEKETSSGSDTLFSGSRFCNPDAVGRSGQSDHRSRPSICKTHIDSNSTNKKKNVSQQAEHLAKAAAPMTGRASDEMPPLRDLAQVEATAILQGLVVPNTDCSWLGKFVIHNNEGIARNCDGVLAHLSSCASLKVLEVVDRLPRIIKLEELPRLRIWPSQFMGSQVTEENIGLYFFAKDYVSYDTCYRRLMKYVINNDLALKGNLDGIELLIFPSNILPERSQLWNQMMFLWGVFKVQKVSPLRDLAQVEATALLQGLVPNTDRSWLGKFVIHNSEGIARNCDGVLAHLSSCASLKVLEVVDTLPRIIKLEELPRLRIWPSQFMGSQVTEENIGLYFFAKDCVSYDTCYRGLVKYMINNDLALKGNLDGVELLIFPSNILPERSQFWNQMMFLWGVFKVQKANNSANTLVSNSLMQGNGDTVK